ncbi:imidazole glycerol phosphate synthase subunit HisH [Cyanobium sp. Alchichica 3B3-8F6]|uniref:imidazole glycerol phosphate synthase subunit HisH n=1 Tax=unclassified Cyanobium TaxID=2627006 RepID=UPI0020CB6D3A|nr:MULTISPECIES: imidazole glycerol phosphate synthase subunit HisH [unclassified Cyanobium]MCP9882455.1 imidazole glycerol phosphate synthase subunit HisH [Cyanobium sp. Alchichica 3B3-8F6]MCP9941548.1 imidazole glycerol phosphate synthase subunit HisH [Cyanobium sp. ATX 6E8]
MTRLGLIDYGMGNLHSVQRAFERLGAVVQPVSNAAEMDGCTALVLPGVGAFDPAMQRLRQGGLAEAITRWCAAGKPLLGICLGLQLLFEASDEGTAAGLGLLKGRVRALPRCPGQPIPHMGWEPLIAANPSPLLPAGGPDTWVYFVHSYAAEPNDPACNTALVRFGDTAVTAAVWQGAIGACQFHPEKSGPHGEVILRRWLAWLAAQ